MYSVVYRIYFWLKRIEKRSRENNQTISAINKFLLDYCEWFYNIPYTRWCQKFPCKKSGINAKKRKEKIIVSLTTYPKRISTIWLTIDSLLRQTVKPDEIILWLANSQFENGLDDLPDSLLQLQRRGLTIRFCDDLRSHKKYYFALQEYPDDLVILADDDMFYPRDTIAKLLDMHKQHPQDICCMTAQVIDPGFTAMPSVWRNPKLEEHDLQHSDQIQAFTGSGTLIPSGALPKEAFDAEKIKFLCLHADDLWITFMAHLAGTKITTQQKWRPFPVTIYGTAAGSLYYINAEENQNDVQWQNLLDHYGADSIKG